MGSHTKTLAFIMVPGMEWPLVLGLTWLKKWNPLIDKREGQLKFPNKRTPTQSMHGYKVEDLKQELVSALSKQELKTIPKEYHDLVEDFSVKRLDELPHHQPIEIVPGAKLPKPKLYSMTPRELVELCKFIDKNVAQGFTQLARPRIAVPVLFWEKKDRSLHP